MVTPLPKWLIPNRLSPVKRLLPVNQLLPVNRLCQLIMICFALITAGSGLSWAVAPVPPKMKAVAPAQPQNTTKTPVSTHSELASTELASTGRAQQPANSTCSPLLDVKKRLLASKNEKHLCDYQGKVILVVNTASKCGFTPQYEGLERLYAQYADQGLVVLGFPSNDFMGQEPGSEQEIASFCRLTYGVKFPMFAKTAVKRGTDDPFYQGLAQAADDTYPKWNFYKYLIDRNGQLVDVYSSMTKPEDEDLVETLQRLLKPAA